MLESLLQAISLQDPLTIFLTYTQERNPTIFTTRVFTKPMMKFSQRNKIALHYLLQQFPPTMARNFTTK